MNGLLVLAELTLAGVALAHRDIERASVFSLAALLAGTVTVLHQAAKRADRYPVIAAFWKRWHLVVQGLPVMSYVTASIAPDLVAHRDAFDSQDWVLTGLLVAVAIGAALNLASALRQRPT